MFLIEPHFAVVDDGKWRLTRPMIYFSGMLAKSIEVPDDFITDLASIPRFFQRVLPVNDSHRLAAVLHDYLYSIKGKLPGGPNLTRAQFDAIFLEAMRWQRVPAWKRTLIYNAVRVGGGSHWNK